MNPLFKQKDNADGQLNVSISASTLVLILKSGEGAEFPQPIKDSATSAGTKILLNVTGASGLGLTVGDYIYNVTDSSFAFIKSIDTNSVETSPLYGGVANIWGNADVFATRRFVATLNKRDSNGNITQSEQVLVDERSSDTLTVPTGGRGYNSTTPAPYDADDYVSILVDELLPDGIESVMNGLDQKKFEGDFSQAIPNDTTLKSRDNADSADVDLFKLTTGDVFEFQILPRNPSSRSIIDDYDIADKKHVAVYGGSLSKHFLPPIDDSNANVSYQQLNQHLALNFVDGSTGDAVFSTIVPEGATGIDSVKIIYYNTSVSTNLYLKLESRYQPLGATWTQDGLSVATYGSTANNNVMEKLTVPTTAYDGLPALVEGSTIGFLVERSGGSSNDTYNANWYVLGLEITFS